MITVEKKQQNMNSKMQTKPTLKLLDEQTFKSNGMMPKGKKVGLEVRFYKRTKDCQTIGKVYETPYLDEESAIKFAENKLKYPNWKLDKGFLQKQLK